MPVYKSYFANSFNNAVLNSSNKFSRFPPVLNNFFSRPWDEGLSSCFLFAYAEANHINQLTQNNQNASNQNDNLLHGTVSSSKLANGATPSNSMELTRTKTSSYSNSNTMDKDVLEVSPQKNKPSSSLSLQQVRCLESILEKKREDGMTLCQEAMLDGVQAVMNKPNTFYELYNTVSEGVRNSELLKSARRNGKNSRVAVEEIEKGNDIPLWDAICNIFKYIQEFLWKLIVPGPKTNINGDGSIELNEHTLNVMAMGFSAALLSVFRIFTELEEENPRLAQTVLDSMVDLLFSTFHDWDTATKNKVVNKFLKTYV